MLICKISFQGKYLSVRVTPKVEKFFQEISKGRTRTSVWQNIFYDLDEESGEALTRRFKNFDLFKLGAPLLGENNKPNLSFLRAKDASKHHVKITISNEDIDRLGLFFYMLELNREALEEFYDFISKSNF